MAFASQNKFYNDPNLGAAFNNLAGIFAPPSGSDLAGYATAAATKEKAARLAELFSYSKTKDYDQTTADRMGVLAGLYAPNQSYYSVDQGNAVTMRGQDLNASTALKMNALDNETRIKTNAADNERSAFTSLYATPIGQNEMLPAVPAEVAQKWNLPARDPVVGAIVAGQGDKIVAPDGRTILGKEKPLSETEWQASQNQRLMNSRLLTDQMLVDAVLGKETPVVTVKDGKPIFSSPGAAVRESAEAFEKGPSTIVNMTENGDKLGDPEPGLVWARNPDGKVKLDERGAPIAIPYQGGKRYAELEDAERAKASKTANQSVKNDIVAQDIDRALSSITDNPAFTTGIGGQLTQNLGGTPANDVRALLEAVKANIGFDQLQALREASPTGGALGQVTEKEQALLQSVLGSLESSQSPEQLSYNLKRLKNVYLDTIHGTGNGPIRETLAPAATTSESQAMPRRAVNPDTGEELILRNGKWEPAQ